MVEVSSKIYESRILAPELEIMRETPWSRIRGQNSVDRNLEDYWQWEANGQFLKETIAVSVTMSINVQKWHCRIRLRIVSCSRMKDEHREPEVPEEEGVPVVECLDGHARITSEGTCTNSFCEKWHPPECLFYKTKSGSRFGEKFSYAHRQVDEQPCNRSKKKDDKCAVAMLKKHELHGRTGKSVVCRDTRHEPNHGHIVCNSSIHDNLVVSFRIWSRRSFSSILRKSSDMQKPIQRVKFTKAVARHTKIRDQNPSLGLICQVNLISVAPTLQNLRIGLWRRQSGKSKVPVKQRGSWPNVSYNERRKTKQHSSHLRKIGACLRQLLNLRNENLFWTPERRCMWSANTTWMMLKWILWRSRVVLR